MSNYYGNQWSSVQSGGGAGRISVSMANTFLQRVFIIMTFGLGITGLTSLLFGNAMLESEAYRSILYNLDPVGQIVGVAGLGWVVTFAPFVFILVLSFGINRLSVMMASLLFGLFALVMGLSLSSIFLVYSNTSIALTFFVTAGTFGAMALIGMTTKMDLTKMGSILMMVLIGIVIASLVNFFVGSSMLQTIISILGVIVFSGLTAYDTQRMLNMGNSGAHADDPIMKKAAIYGALSLYMNFINLFLFLLQLMGGNRE